MSETKPVTSIIIDLYDSETIHGEYLNIWRDEGFVHVQKGNVGLDFCIEEFHDLAEVLYNVSHVIEPVDTDDEDNSKEFLERRKDEIARQKGN